jgi:hypothetical protein
MCIFVKNSPAPMIVTQYATGKPMPATGPRRR